MLTQIQKQQKGKHNDTTPTQTSTFRTLAIVCDLLIALISCLFLDWKLHSVDITVSTEAIFQKWSLTITKKPTSMMKKP